MEITKKEPEMVPYLALLLSAVLAFLDQMVKVAVYNWLRPVGDLPLIEGVIHLTYLENRGMAFGMMEGQKWLLIWVTAFVLLLLIAAIILGKIRKTSTLVTTAVIIGGGVGNLIDRVYRGYVIDYINLEIINFAIFNLADICVTCGTAVLLVILAREMIQEEKETKARKAAKGD